MAAGLILVLGETQAPPAEIEIKHRTKLLRATVEKYLPDFVRMVKTQEVKAIVLHQDAFAAGYHHDEYILLGMAVKYAGLYGKEICFGTGPAEGG